MDATSILICALLVVAIVAVVALAVFLFELVKTVKVARTTVEDVKEQMTPVLNNVSAMADDLKPAVAKVDPMVDRVQLTLDALNLEMMRLDMILEDVSDITDSASSATKAVDTVASAPAKLVTTATDKMRSTFGGKKASDEAAQLAEQRVAVAQALEDYRAAEEKDAKKAANRAKREAAGLETGDEEAPQKTEAEKDYFEYEDESAPADPASNEVAPEEPSVDEVATRDAE